MSQNDTPQQGILGVRSFALQQFESDSEASSVRSSGIDSPPLERKPEEKDSARRATLAALGLVVGPPPPVQQQQQQQQPSTSPSVTPGGVSPIGSRSPQSRSPRELPPPGHPSAAVGDLRRPNSPTQSVWAGSFSPDSKQSGSSFSPSASRGISSTNSVVDNDANRSSVYNRVKSDFSCHLISIPAWRASQKKYCIELSLVMLCAGGEDVKQSCSAQICHKSHRVIYLCSKVNSASGILICIGLVCPSTAHYLPSEVLPGKVSTMGLWVVGSRSHGLCKVKSNQSLMLVFSAGHQSMCCMRWRLPHPS